MAEKTEFEESEYEASLYNQLLDGSLNIWTPGRVFERSIGIDSAVYANNDYFWSLFDHPEPIDGVSLRKYNLRFLWGRHARRIRPLPSFSVNLLIQAKRPEHRKGINAIYSKYGIKGQYWQFSIKNHQQEILEQLEEKLGDNALVIYACPVFHKFEELNEFIEDKWIVENSTFVKPSVLRDHKKWVFDTPGTRGLACSQKYFHKEESFEKMVKRLLNKFKEEDRELSYKNLNKLNDYVNEIVSKNKDNPMIKMYLRRNENMKIWYKISRIGRENIENDDEIFKIMSFKLFTKTLGLMWLTK